MYATCDIWLDYYDTWSDDEFDLVQDHPKHKRYYDYFRVAKRIFKFVFVSVAVKMRYSAAATGG